MVKEKLKYIIDELGLSPEEFGDSIGVGKSSIYKVLRGDTKKITTSLAKKINAQYPQYSISHLVNLMDSTLLDTEKLKVAKLRHDSKLEEKFKGITTNELARYILLKEKELDQDETFILWKKGVKKDGAIEILKAK